MNRSNLVWISLAVLILIVLFVALKPKPSNTTVQTAQGNTPQTASSSAQASNIKSFNLVVKDNKLVSGPDTLTVTEGDQVSITITADVDGELHLHGYDIPLEFKKDTPATMNFTAKLTGRFPYELENTKTEIGALEVQPK